MGSSSRVWQFLVLMLALVLRAVGQSEMKRQVSSRLDPVEAKTTLTAEDAIVRINQRIFQYEKPWRSFLIEGDIIKPLWRNAVLSESKTWQKSPDGMVRIPYKISQQYDEETRSSIIRGFKDFEKFTCVQFLPHSDEDDFISIQPIHGCYSSVGRVGGMQLISLNHQCLKKGKGVVEHEIMHSLGFWHEHARSDRDKYIKIEWKNVWPGYEHNFLKQNTNNLMSKYDYGSILHYSRTAFSKNGQPTLRKLMDTDAVIGQRIRLSELDLLKVNRLYNCTTHLKDKANLLKHTEAFMHKEGRDPITNLDTQKHSLTLLYEDGSFRELGRAKEAGRLKPALDISPGKGRVHTSAHLVMASGGNGSIINWTMTATRRYPECFLVHKCSPTSWLTKLVPAVDSTSRTAVSKEPALEASGDQMELLGVAQVHKGKTETLFPTLTELPFVQSLTTNAVTTRSLLHKMSSALTMPSLTQRPTACPKAYVTCFTEEPVLPPQSQKTVGHIELLPTFPRALKISNQTQESMLFLADSFTAGRQGLRPLNWTDPPDTYTQTARVIHQSSPSVGFLPTVTNAIYPKRLSISHQRLKHSHQQRFPILPPVTQTQVTRLLKTVTPASEIKVPAVPGQPLIAGTGTTIAPEPLSTQIEEANNGQIRTATQTKAPTVASHTKGLAFLLRTGILASCNKACRSQASLVPTMPPPTESLLVSTLPGESLLVSTRTSTLPRPPEILLVSTPPVESLLVSTPPAEPQVTSTLSSTLPPPAEKLLVTNSLAEYLLVSTSPAEPLLVSIPPAEPQVASTLSSTLPPPAERLLVTNSLPESLLVSTPPAESLLVSTPTAAPQVASTLSSTLPPPAERLLVTNSLPESLLVSTPPAESLLVSTPTAAPQVASTLSSTLPPPAESLLVSISLAESVLVSTPPAEPPLASTLSSTLLSPAESLLVSTPPAESLLVSTPPAESLLVSTSPAEPPVASTLSSTLPPPAESLLASTPPAESLLVSTPPAESLLVSTPPAESLLVSTSPAEPPVASILSSTLPPAESLLESSSLAESLLVSTPPAESLLVSTPPAESLLVSTPPAESLLLSTPPAESLLVSTPPAELPVASILSSTLPPAESLLESSSLAESLLASTPPAESLLASTPPAESLLASTPPAESLLVSTPPAESLLVSTPPAESLLVSTPPAESLLLSTPPAESLLVSTPPAELPVASILSSTLPPAESLLESSSLAESLLAPTPPAESLLVSTPPAEPLLASILSSTLPPPAESLLVSSSLAESLLVSTPPAEPSVASILSSTLPPAESLLESSSLAESLLVSTPPAESLVSTPPAESLLASTPPAESLLVSTPPAEPSVASILSSTLPPPAESLLVSSSLAESLLVSTPPAEPSVASILSSTLPPPAESLLVSSSLAESLLVSTPPAEPPLPSTFSTLPPPAESLLVFIPTAGTSAFDSRSLISPLTLTRLFNPVVSNPLYDVNMISPSHSVLSDELSVELLCDFEHGLCDWEQSTTDDFDWMLHRHQTLSRETGPKRDHTKGQCKGQGGRYLYLEASYPQQSGEQAALISPLLRGQKCLAFWYNMFGKHMGSLNVFLKYENSPHWHKLWSVSGNQGRKWLNAEIDIFTNGEMYRVIIEGVLGLNYRSDAAIDDVQIYRSSCAPGKKHPPSCNRGLKKRDKSLMG